MTKPRPRSAGAFSYAPERDPPSREQAAAPVTAFLDTLPASPGRRNGGEAAAHGIVKTRPAHRHGGWYGPFSVFQGIHRRIASTARPDKVIEHENFRVFSVTAA